ncbi:MAG: hypothetical protein ACK47B_12555 [Armatimonadota bacterium]
MPVRRHPPDWRQLSAESTVEVVRALEEFATSTRASLRVLAKELGVNPADLSPSHLRNRALLLFWALRREMLPSVALRLRLDLEGFRALERLSSRITQALGGYELPDESWKESRREALEAGELGVELFDRHEWLAATSHLAYAWEMLSPAPPEPSEPGYAVVLRTGSQLVNWFCYAGRARDAAAVTTRLLRMSSGYRGVERPVLSAIGCVHRAAAVVSRHHGLDAPAISIRHGRQAHRLFSEFQIHRPGEAAILRDQAKVYVAWSLGCKSEVAVPERSRDALVVLDQAEQLLAEQGDRQVEQEWLDTRLTRAECLALLGQSSNAVRCWEATRASERSCRLMSDGNSTSRSCRLAMVELALDLARGDLNAVAERARWFRAQSTFVAYADRLARVQEVEAAALVGDRRRACAALLR